MSKELPNLTDIFQAVLDAKEKLESAKCEEDAARGRATDARNKFNEATRRFDEAVKTIRADAPWNTDWWALKNKGVKSE